VTNEESATDKIFRGTKAQERQLETEREMAGERKGKEEKEINQI